MPLFTSPPATSSAPPKATQLAQRARGIRDAAKRNYRELCRMQREGIKALWQNDNLTPQEICDALGTDAVKLFDAHGALTTVCAAIAAADGVTPDILLPSNAFTRNPNGTVTVLESPYAP